MTFMEKCDTLFLEVWKFMNLGKESEMLEFKKTTGELKEAMVSISAILNEKPNLPAMLGRTG